MSHLPDSSAPIRRSVVLDRAVTKRFLTGRGSAAPTPDDLFPDDSSEFSCSMPYIKDSNGLPFPGTYASVQALALMRSYVPAPWFECTAQSYYASRIRSKMGPCSIALVAQSFWLGSAGDSVHPTHVTLVPPEAGMFIRPITLPTTPFRPESALPWISFTTSPVITARVIERPMHKLEEREVPVIVVSIKVEDVIDASLYYMNLVNSDDLSIFVKSLETLEAMEITHKFMLMDDSLVQFNDWESRHELSIKMRLCLYFHEIVVADYDPL